MPLTRAGEGGGVGRGNPRFGSRGVSSPCIPCATMRNKGNVQNVGRARGLLYHLYAMLCPHRTLCHVPMIRYITYPCYAMPRGAITCVRSRQNGQWGSLARATARWCTGAHCVCKLFRCVPARCRLGRRHAATWVDDKLLRSVTTNCFAMCLQVNTRVACGYLPTVPVGRYSARRHSAMQCVYKQLRCVTTNCFVMCLRSAA